MAISAINSSSPAFNGDLTTKVCTGVKKTVFDPTDVNNKDAAVGGAVAVGGVSGAAVVASRLNTMKKVAITGQNMVNRAGALKAKNLSLLSDLAVNVTKFFKETKATAWLARLMEKPFVKKIGGAAGGALALGITAAQIYSAGDMAVEAIDTYSK